ncbi:unnamed protein product [Sphagnum troendelagicum]|uniref:Uncharacterized protein n=1 Tax=Sphagnum troendelagicum TaxID=128251 RepID=A0ABP0T970_9BRYO
MVGIFVKFPRTTRSSSNRSQQFLDSGKASRTKVLVNAGIRINTNRSSSSSSSSPHHGVEPLDRFVPVEHPSEPFDIDQPIQCPRTEPGIMLDARIWKERLAARLKQRADLLGEISLPSSNGSNWQHTTTSSITRKNVVLHPLAANNNCN